MPRDAQRDRLIRLASAVCAVPHAWLYALRDGRWSLEAGEPPLAAVDALLAPLLFAATGDRMAEPDPLHLGFFLAHPLHDAAGRLVGALCLGDPDARTWTEADARNLGDLVDLVATGLGPVWPRDASISEDRQRLELYDALLQAQDDLGEGVVMLDRRDVVYANDAFTAICGYRAAEIMDAGTLEGMVLPEDRELLLARIARRQAGEAVSDRYEIGITHKAGHRVHLEVAVKTVTVHDRQLSVLLVRDATERMRTTEQLRESELRFRHLAEAAFEAIALSENGVVLDINPAHVRMFGYAPDELIGQSGFHLIVPEAREGVMRRVRAADDRPYEVQCQRKDGSTFTAEVRTGSYHYQGRVIRFSAMRDMTERRAVERLKEEFVSVVSHELRTPLTAIVGSLGLLASGRVAPLAPKAEHLLSLAASNADRLVRLVNDILDIERLESGKVPLVYAPVDAADLLTSAAEGVRPLADRAQVRLEVAPVPGALSVDADRMHQLLTNLLSNAIKFSPAGGVVRLAMTREAAAWRIIVTDEGRGIPADKLEAIFGRFQQVESSDSRQKGGTGLGLAICRQIAEQHGGRIWAESSPGMGSTFNVALPAERPTTGQRKER